MSVLEQADAVESTSGMLRYVRNSPSKEFIVVTEQGMNHRLRKEFPQKVFHDMSPSMICRNMKKTSLDSVLKALRLRQYEISPEPALMERARIPLERMIGIG
jgi:quinolinate synthase